MHADMFPKYQSEKVFPAISHIKLIILTNQLLVFKLKHNRVKSESIFISQRMLGDWLILITNLSVKTPTRLDQSPSQFQSECCRCIKITLIILINKVKTQNTQMRAECKKNYLANIRVCHEKLAQWFDRSYINFLHFFVA